MESWQDIRLFIGDMSKHWVGKMTGALSLVLGFSPLAFPDWFSGNPGLLHNRGLWEITAAISFFVAAYTAWLEKRREVVRLSEDLHALTVPNLDVSVERDMVGPDSLGNTVYFLWIKIINRGAPSTATLTDLRVSQSDGTVLPVFIFPQSTENLTIPNVDLNGERGVTLVLKTEEHFNSLFFKRSIQRGTSPIGWLHTRIQGSPETIFREGTKMSAFIIDINGKKNPLEWTPAVKRNVQDETLV